MWWLIIQIYLTNVIAMDTLKEKFKGGSEELEISQ